MKDLVSLVKNLPEGEVCILGKRVGQGRTDKPRSPRIKYYDYQGKRLNAEQLFELDICRAKTIGTLRAWLSRYNRGDITLEQAITLTPNQTKSDDG